MNDTHVTENHITRYVPKYVYG